MHTTRNSWAALLCLAGASAAIFISGSQEEWANIVFLAASGLALLILRPSARPGWAPVLLGVFFLAAAAASFLPFETFAVPGWRQLLTEEGVVQLGATVSPQPWVSVFWWGLLVCSGLIGMWLLTAALDEGALASFLRAVSVTVAVYTVVSIADFHTAWSYPFGGGAPFGLLPNKNHTATLLVVGAVVSLGLMFWDVTRGSRAAAFLAALCGAPPLAALLFFSNARAGVVFLLFGLVVWAAGAGQEEARKKLLIGVGAVLFFAGALFLAGGSEVRERLYKLVQNAVVAGPGESGETASIANLDFRLPVFRDTWRMIRDQPIEGVGLGQFLYVFPQYRDETVRAARVLHPESDWLMVAAESGLPAAVLLGGLLVWYVLRSWRGRTSSAGLLHWTAASAVLAAVAHGFVDVPWHRAAVGWFLLVIAAVAVPSTGKALRSPGLARICSALVGLLLIAGAGFLVCEKMGATSFVSPLSWPRYSERMAKLGQEMRYEEGLALAKEVLRIFPLESDAHYWALAFARGDARESDNYTASGRQVEPVLPQFAVSQSALWKDFDESREAEAWVEAVRRAALIDERDNSVMRSSAASMLQQAIRNLAGKPNAQRVLRVSFEKSPPLLSVWVGHADASVVDEFLGQKAGAETWLDTLPEDTRGQILQRWVTLDSGGAAVAYMEIRNAANGRPYWRQLANYYAKEGDKARAVGMVAEAMGLPLAAPLTGGQFGGQLAALEVRGNSVSVRRLLKEAAEGKKADPEELRVAVTWFAAAGDWEMAWKAASRLVTATKTGQ